MIENQQILAELLKLKSFLVGKYAAHHLFVHVGDMLDQVNTAIENVQKHNQNS